MSTSKKKAKYDTEIDMSATSLGRVPPQAIELEKDVLGAAMLEREAFDRMADILKAECFYLDSHRKIYDVMKALTARSEPIDLRTVIEELGRRKELDLVGGPYYVTTLTNNVVSAANLETHARILVEKFVQRELIRFAGQVLNAAYQDAGDAFEILEYAERCLTTVGESLSLGDMVTIDTVIVEAVKKIEGWRLLDTSITGIPTGFHDLDNATHGWQNGDLIIIAARPSVGKTALALHIIREAAKYFKRQDKGQTVAMWSLEMRAVMLILRMLAAESQIWMSRIQTGRMGEDDMFQLYEYGVKMLAKLGILFDDTSGVTIQKLRTKARRLKRKNGLGLIVVDYLQLMSPEERQGTREQEISSISRALKGLALELDIPVIALSQLSREVEKRDQKRPQLSDLRESGAIEQDADVVIFLWAPSPEQIQHEEDPGRQDQMSRIRYVRIAKQRNGLLGSFEIQFTEEVQRFAEVEKKIEKTAQGTLYSEPKKEEENAF